MQRPDMTGLPADIQAYIEALEAEIESLRAEGDESRRGEAPLEPSEPPTTINIITVSAAGESGTPSWIAAMPTTSTSSGCNSSFIRATGT